MCVSVADTPFLLTVPVMGPSFFRAIGLRACEESRPRASGALSSHAPGVSARPAAEVNGVAMAVSVSPIEPLLPAVESVPHDGSAYLACLLEVVQAVNSTLQLQQVLNLILDRAIGVMQAEAGSIMMLDESSGELQVRAARGTRAAE